MGQVYGRAAGGNRREPASVMYVDNLKGGTMEQGRAGDQVYISRNISFWCLANWRGPN